MEAMEIVRPWEGKGYDIRYALFDFDGTISLIREGWQNIMIPYFVEVLKETGTSESDAHLLSVVTDFVDTLTGKQTIYQCIALDEEVVKRGGPHRDPLVYKHEYLRRLEIRIENRKKALEAGTEDPEAHLLGLDGVFAGGIHGAHDHMLSCSKELVIRDMLEKEGIKPNQLVSFGDGYVEVELVANLGGLAIGAATNEETREGINEWKRNRLITAGANAIIPDFRNRIEILDAIL